MQYTFFDFDGTLTKHDSFTGFIRHVRGLFGLGIVLMRSAPAIILWKSGMRNAVYAKKKMFSAAFAGMSHKDFVAEGKRYAPKIEKMIRPVTLERLQEAVKRGDRVAIVSASFGDWIRPWAESHGVANVIATEPEIDSNGRLTGDFATPNCSHEEKTRRVLERFPELERERLRHCVTVYGDSAGDSALFIFADEAWKIVKGYPMNISKKTT